MHPYASNCIDCTISNLQYPQKVEIEEKNTESAKNPCILICIVRRSTQPKTKLTFTHRLLAVCRFVSKLPIRQYCTFWMYIYVEHNMYGIWLVVYKGVIKLMYCVCLLILWFCRFFSEARERVREKEMWFK